MDFLDDPNEMTVLREKSIASFPGPIWAVPNRGRYEDGKALDRFIEIVGELRTTLETIQEAADNHFDVEPGEVAWGHVGDANRTLAGLEENLAVIRGEAK